MKAKRNIVYKEGVLKIFHPRNVQKFCNSCCPHCSGCFTDAFLQKFKYLTKRLKVYKPDNNTLSNYPYLSKSFIERHLGLPYFCLPWINKRNHSWILKKKAKRHMKYHATLWGSTKEDKQEY